MLAKAGDVYCFYIEELGKYGTVQIIAISSEDNQVAVLLLDYLNKQLPTINDLNNVKPFYNTRWFFNNKSIDYCWVETLEVPTDYIYIDNIVPIVTKKCTSFRGGWSFGTMIVLEEEWKLIPSIDRDKFKKALNDGSEVKIKDIVCRKSFTTISDDLLYAVTDFSQLNVLGAAYRIEAKRYYEQLIPYLETKIMIRELELLNHQQNKLDFSKTHLANLKVSTEGLKELILNDNLKKLDLIGTISPQLKIHSPNDGKYLYLSMSLLNNPITNLGLPKLKGVIVSNINYLDLTLIPK